MQVSDVDGGKSAGTGHCREEERLEDRFECALMSEGFRVIELEDEKDQPAEHEQHDRGDDGELGVQRPLAYVPLVLPQREDDGESDGVRRRWGQSQCS